MSASSRAPLYMHEGELLTARQIAKAVGQTHVQTRSRLYAGLPPKIVEGSKNYFGTVERKND